MSTPKETRRSFIKNTASNALLATNTAALVGLINTPGTANADSTASSGNPHKKKTVTQYVSGPTNGGSLPTYDQAKISAEQAAQLAATATVLSTQDPCSNSEPIDTTIADNGTTFSPASDPGGPGPFTVSCTFKKTFTVVALCDH